MKNACEFDPKADNPIQIFEFDQLSKAESYAEKIWEKYPDTKTILAEIKKENFVESG